MSDIRILIVEDDPFIAMDIESAVAEQFGAAAELIVVDSVTQAQRAAAAELSCALLDIDVVGGKTFEVAERLLQRGTPFAFVSGSTPSDVPEPLRKVRFLRKPFSTREIASFVSTAVARPAAP
ncbi:response regulator [Bosea sp. (in: a-proteobacteria)]|uniref:response regulator n=1 Tax=Bosea sp. (in: a-proteobacteria) TaxID=1871050 RepID=UPI0027371BFE|nr:response regulator [Bosea sp. (in: a-proteobacteria)]MDP3409459.1 response regulator [Bosea sp. (in: a-proteobacteria)]